MRRRWQETTTGSRWVTGCYLSPTTASRPVAEARALGFAQAEAIRAKAEEEQQREQRFREDVERLTQSLSSGDLSDLPIGSSICLSINPVGSDKKPRAIAVTLWPLEPITIEEVVRSGALKRHVYERLVKEAGLGGLLKMQISLTVAERRRPAYSSLVDDLLATSKAATIPTLPLS